MDEKEITEKISRIAESSKNIEANLLDIAISLRVIAERPPLNREPIKKDND